MGCNFRKVLGCTYREGLVEGVNQGKLSKVMVT